MPDLGLGIDSQHAWLAVPAIGGWLVLMCLRLIAEDLEYAIRLRRLELDADQLREKQTRRLRELGIKRRP